MADADLIEKALAYAPWVAPILAAVILLRKEIGGFLSAGRNETALEGLMGNMVGLFQKNLEYFANVEKGMAECARNTATTNEHLKDVLEVQRGIKEQVMLQNARQK